MQDKKIAQILLDKKAVKLNLENPFTFTTGMRSPIYVDNRILISYPKERDVIVEKLMKLVKDFKKGDLALAGTATAAIPWAAFVAERMYLPMVYVRPKPKEHGTGQQVEGQIPKGSDVLVVEDMISTGSSSLGTAEALKREYDANVLGVVAIYSHTLAKSEENFKEAGMDLKYLTDFETVVNTAVEQKYLDEGQKESVLRWREEGPEWGAKLGLVKTI